MRSNTLISRSILTNLMQMKCTFHATNIALNYQSSQQRDSIFVVWVFNIQTDSRRCARERACARWITKVRWSPIWRGADASYAMCSHTFWERIIKLFLFFRILHDSISFITRAHYVLIDWKSRTPNEFLLLCREKQVDLSKMFMTLE